MPITLDPLDLTATSIRTWMSPFHDCKQAYLDFLAGAQRSIHINIFGFHIPEVTALLIAKHRAGVKVDVILDHSQAQGVAELAELQKLMKAKVPILIGTSFRGGQLLHLKATVVDEARVECGSWNYSESATDQLNDLMVIDDAREAHFYLLAHDVIRAFILHHELIFQPRGEVAPDAATPGGADTTAADPNPTAGQVHRKDVAAPWLENATAASATPAPAKRHPRSKVKVTA